MSANKNKLTSRKPRSILERLRNFVDGGQLARLSGHEARVLLALFRFANYDNGQCFPSTITLAERTGMNKRVVQRTLAGLERKGIIKTITRGNGRGHRTVREILVTQGNKRVTAGATLSNVKGDSGEHTKGDNMDQERVTKRARKGDSGCHQNSPIKKSGEEVIPTPGRSGMKIASLPCKRVRLENQEHEDEVSGLLRRQSARLAAQRNGKGKPAFETRSERNRLATREAKAGTPCADKEADEIIKQLNKWGVTIKARTLVVEQGPKWCRKLLRILSCKMLEIRDVEKVSHFARWCAGHPSEVDFGDGELEMDDRDARMEAECAELDEGIPGYGKCLLKQYYDDKEKMK